MERQEWGERRRERDEEGMRERDRWGRQWVREGGRLKKRDRDRERRGSETDVPKLYTYNEYEHSVGRRGSRERVIQ